MAKSDKQPLLTKTHSTKRFSWLLTAFLVFLSFSSDETFAAEKLIGVQSGLTISQSMPWIAQEAGLFLKRNLDFQLVYIASSGMVTAAMLGGDAEVALVGAVGPVRAYVQGATDLVFIGSVKNILTHSILAKPEIKKLEDLRGKKIGLARIGSNPHYFAIQALRSRGLDPARDVVFIQTGGTLETLTALIKGNVDAATMTAPTDAKAIAQGFHYVVYGPDLQIPYAAVSLMTRRTLIARRPQVIAQFMRVMAEATRILHTNRELTYRVLGKHLRIDDREVLDASYNAEIKALSPRMEIKREALEAILDEVAQTDPRAKKIKPEDLVDRRYLDEMEKSGFFDRLWPSR